MKYIRTNKEILYLVSEPIYADDGACEQDCYECITSKDKTRYIYEDYKKADTIEELCDEFIYDFYRKHLRCYYSPNTNTWVDEESGCDLRKYFVKTIKGAIWTDKGLIYVAKMNDKGELELL